MYSGRGSDEEIERLLREGAYGTLMEDEEQTKRMEAFCEAGSCETCKLLICFLKHMRNEETSGHANPMHLVQMPNTHLLIFSDRFPDHTRKHPVVFLDIATLLVRDSRVVAYDRPGAINFSKTRSLSSSFIFIFVFIPPFPPFFNSFSTGEPSVNMEDPDFWSLVLGKDFRETLMTRLTDGTATSSSEQKRSFLDQVQQLGQKRGSTHNWSLRF